MPGSARALFVLALLALVAPAAAEVKLTDQLDAAVTIDDRVTTTTHMRNTAALHTQTGRKHTRKPAHHHNGKE